MSTLKTYQKILLFPFGVLLSIILIFFIQKSEEIDFFYKNEVRHLSGKLTLTSNVVTIDLNPVLKIKNKVQYVAVFVKNANGWVKDSKSVGLLDSSGKKININISIQNESGKIYGLSEVSFGKALMFSFCCSGNQSNSDLHATDQFANIQISSSRPLLVEKIEWHDILNK